MSLRPGKKSNAPYVGIVATSITGDHKVLADGTDNTAEYLEASLVAGTNIALTVVDKGGGNKAVKIDASDTDTNDKVRITAADTTTNYLENKILAGTNVSITKENPAGNEDLKIAAADPTAKASAGDTTASTLDNKIVAGTNITITKLNPGGNESLSIAAATSPDIKVKVDASDTTSDYLDGKIAAGTNISKTTLNPGGNEQVSLSAADPTVKVSAGDTTASRLESKILAGTNITVTKENAGGNEDLKIAASDSQVKASAGDTTPSTLDNKMVAGTNITITKLNPGANESLSIAASAASLDYKFKVSSADTTANYAENKILAGTGINVTKENAGGNEDLKVSLAVNAIPSFRDEFYYYKPFWDGIPAVDSGRWAVDLVNHYLKCVSGTTEDEIRIQMEGDFDLQLKMYHPGTGTSTKTIINSDGDTVEASIEFDGSNITAKCTGKSNTVIANANTTLWTRYVRDGIRNLKMYYKINDGDAWTQIVAYTDIDLGTETELNLIGNTNSRLLNIIIYDNTGSAAVGARQQKRAVALTDGANITTDCTRGDIFYVTLGGNRTLLSPVSNERDQRIIYRIKQDGTGGRTLAWGGDFRFPGGTAPTLSTGINKTDYFGFIYNEQDSKWDLVAEQYNL